MAKPIFSPGSAIQRAKPLFELSDAGGETHCGKRAKKSTKVALPARAEQVIPFNSETILEAINCSPGISLGSSGSQGDLAHLDLELADAKDLFAESITRTIDGELPEQGTERLSRRDGDDTTNAGTDPMLSAMPSRSLVSLAPLKAPLQKFKGPNRSSMAHSAPRVAQRYQLRHPDDLIAEASERRRIVDELLQLESQRRRKVEELARIYKREKVAEGRRVQDQKSSELMNLPSYSSSLK